MIIFSLIFSDSYTQSINRQVIASAGGYDTSSIGSLSWTLGETIVETVENSSINFILTQGFQQPDEFHIDTIDAVHEIGSNIFISLYPNPVAQILNLTIRHGSVMKMQIQLLDMLGRMIHYDEMNGTEANSNYQIDVNALAVGMYALKMYTEGKFIGSCKFQKL